MLAGVILAMMEDLADFVTVATFGYRTLTEAIYRVWLGMFDRTAATHLASLLLLFAFLLLGLERALRGRARFVQSHRRRRGARPAVLRGSPPPRPTALLGVGIRPAIRLTGGRPAKAAPGLLASRRV